MINLSDEVRELLMSPTFNSLPQFLSGCPLDLNNKSELLSALSVALCSYCRAIDAGEIECRSDDASAGLMGLAVMAYKQLLDNLPPEMKRGHRVVN